MTFCHTHFNGPDNKECGKHAGIISFLLITLLRLREMSLENSRFSDRINQNVPLWPSDIFGKFSQLLSCDVSMNDNYKKVMLHQISLHQENSLSEHSISWKLFQELSVRVQQIVSEYQALTIIYCFHRGSFVFRGKDSFEGSEKTKCDRGEDKLLIKIKKNIIFISCNLVESIIV